MIKRLKEQKQLVIKRILKFTDYKNCQVNNEIILKTQQRFKTKGHNLYAEETDKITPSSNDDKRLQTFDRFTSYLYGTNAGKVSKTELLEDVTVK